MLFLQENCNHFILKILKNKPVSRSRIVYQSGHLSRVSLKWVKSARGWFSRSDQTRRFPPETLPHLLQHDIICLLWDAAGRWHFKSPLWPCCVWQVKRRTQWPPCIYSRGNIKQTLHQLYLRRLIRSFSGVSSVWVTAQQLVPLTGELYHTTPALHLNYSSVN